MRFMIGKAPVRRTVQYFESCKILFRDNVKIFSINYDLLEKHHQGARDFIFWHFNQIQYKNPNVQCITFKNMTPSPFIRIFFDDGKDLIIDIDSRERNEILKHLENFTAICKNQKEIKDPFNLQEMQKSHSYFGYYCPRHCLCEVIGQVPCSTLVNIPKSWRGVPPKNPEYKIPPFYSEPGLEEEEKSES